MNIQYLLDRPIAFHRPFVTITKSVTAALMLSQAIYWANRGKTHADGEIWFYKTQAEWEEETGLSRREQETARKKLTSLGVMKEKRQGVPARMFYSVNFKKLEELLRATNNPNTDGKTSKSSMAESANLSCTKQPSQYGGKRQSNTETTQRLPINKYIDKSSPLDLSCFKQQPSESVWSDYLSHRKAKKAKLTQTALNRLASKINEANEQGYDTDIILAECMLRNWQGFDVSWLQNKKTTASISRQEELEAAWADTSWINDLNLGDITCNPSQH